MPAAPPPAIYTLSLHDALPISPTAIAGAEGLRADIGWTDSLLRSLERVKERCAQQLDQELGRIATAAHAEMLDLEPKIARALNEALEAWVDAAAEVYVRWLPAVVDGERQAREVARTTRQTAPRGERDAIAAHIQRLAALTRTVANTTGRSGR